MYSKFIIMYRVYSKFEEEFHEDILDHIQKIHGETLPQAVS